SRALLDLLGSKAQLTRANDDILQEERSLQQRIAALKAQMTAPQGDEDEEGSVQRINALTLRKQLAEVEQAYKDFLVKVRKENKEQASLMNVEPLTVKQVQDLLDPRVTMLEYFVSGNNVWLWVVERDRVEFIGSIIARKDLVSKVTELRDTIYQL